MKKIKMIGMLALAFTLVFGAVSCKNETEDEGPWGDSLAEVLKEEKNLSLAGTWKAVEGDITADVDVDASDESKLKMLMMFIGKDPEKLTEKDKIAIAISEIGMWAAEETFTKDQGKTEPKEMVDYEKYIKDTYKNGPVAGYSEGQKAYFDINIMINGDRDELRIEFLRTMEGKLPKSGEGMPADLSGKKYEATEEGYVTWKLQK